VFRSEVVKIGTFPRRNTERIYFLGYGPEDSHFLVESIYNYEVESYDIGTGFEHFALTTKNMYKLVKDILGALHPRSYYICTHKHDLGF